MITCMAFDPGYDRLGWAVGDIEAGTVKHLHGYGAVQTSSKDTLHTRYVQILTETAVLLDRYKPTHAALESLFFATNKKTALHVSEARGVLIAQLLTHHCRLSEYTPLQVKQAVTGTGSAEKRSVDKMVRLQLALPTGPILDDTMDALGVLITFAARWAFEERMHI